MNLPSCAIVTDWANEDASPVTSSDYPLSLQPFIISSGYWIFRLRAFKSSGCMDLAVVVFVFALSTNWIIISM